MEGEITVWVAAISAGSAMIGVLFAELVSLLRDYLIKRHTRRVMLREKYERLADLVVESQDWVTEQMNASSLSILRGVQPTAARQAMVLSHIYFPELRSLCESYVSSLAEFQVVLIDNHEFRSDKDAGTQAAHRNPSALEGAVLDLRESRRRLEEAVIAFAGKYAST